MINFIRAHGYDPGPTERPYLAGLITGLLATIPAAAVFVGFGSFRVIADEIIRADRPWSALIILIAFTLAGVLYGAVFRRPANDRRAGWLLGLSYRFVLWTAGPVVVLPVIRRSAMAGGLAATGLFASFLTWGLVAGVLFPWVHHPLHAKLESRSPETGRFGPAAAALKQRLLRRP